MQGSGEHRPLNNKRVALTGRFASVTHDELASLVEELGGRVDKFPGRHTSLLVVGAERLPLDDRALPTRALRRCQELQAAGYAIELITEHDFWDRCSLDPRQESVKRLYTIGQLSQLFGVKRDLLRSWLRAGLIVPSETRHRLAFFDLAQVHNAKMLCELAKSGVPTSRIRASVEQLGRWLPEIGPSLAQIAVLEDNGRLLLRYDADRLAEPSGQLHFCFEEEALDVVRRPRESADDLFMVAQELEDLGRHDDAAAVYREAIDLDPDDPVLHFNLANAEYALDRLNAAEEHLREATRLDPTYAEAWNNLGCVYGDLGHPYLAIEALRRAIELVPEYGDAYFNLAEHLYQEEQVLEACEHYRQCLKLGIEGPWAETCRDRLAEDASRLTVSS